MRRKIARTRRNSILDDFVAWLAQNQDRFPVRLVPYTPRGGLRGDHLEYRFEGVPALRLLVDESTFEVAVRHRRRFIDLLLIADVAKVRRDKEGKYYCTRCRSEGRDEHATDRLALLTEHTFEPFLEWCQEKIRQDSRLVIEGGGPGRWSAASIYSLKQLRSRRKLLHPGFIVEPVIRHRASISRRAR